MDMSNSPTQKRYDSLDEVRRKEVEVFLNVSTKTVLRVLVVISLFVLLVNALEQVAGVLMKIVVAAFLAVAADAVVRSMQRRGVSRGRAVGTFLAGLVLTIVLMLLVFIPPIAEESTRFVEDAPGYFEDVRDSKVYQDLDSRYDVTDKALAEIEDGARTLPARLGDAVGAVVGGIFSAITMFFLIMFLLLGGGDLMRGLLRLFPQIGERRSWVVVQGAYSNIGSYFIGAALQGLIAGVTLTVVLLVVGVPFALPLGLFMLLLDLVPLVGASIGAAPAIAVAFLAAGTWQGFVVLGFIVLYQQVENVVIQPRIMGKVAALPAAMIFVSVLIGAELMGVIGALFAVPVAGVIAIVYRQYLEVTGTSEMILPSLEDDQPPPEPHDPAPTMTPTS